MANIFKIAKDINEHPNRNNFDLSRKSNVSLKFGTLYPVFTQPVVPGDSFDIQAAYNLKLNPVVFPVQTKMRAHMHFFYVRNKNLWKNWQNWISNLPGFTNAEHPHPYLSIPDDRFETGSIHDFLGVPTSLVLNEPLFDAFNIPYTDNVFRYTKTSSANILTALTNLSAITADENGDYDVVFSDRVFNSSFASIYRKKSVGDTLVVRIPTALFSKLQPVSESPNIQLLVFQTSLGNNPNKLYESIPLTLTGDAIVSGVYYGVAEGVITQRFIDSFASGKFRFGLTFKASGIIGGDTLTGSYSMSIMRNQADFYQYSDLGLDLYSNHLHINALPYRAYESIYNCYYRNNVVDPLIVNGVQKYNEYNTTTDDGADSTAYHLFQRNYELDFLTSALPSPQQGVAPLVGMTALGDVTIEDENGITTAHAEIDNDGTISKVVLTSPAASVEHARTAMNIAASGMSINDFRNTNALQRLLETNIRKGYRYIDFIAGHFGKEPEYRELDLPEFIGGFSRDVNVSTVVSNADTLGDDSGAALGSYGGYASLNDGSKHNIRHYCDDYGYIIGILSVVPTPCYSQLLRKDMVAPDNFLDYYFPEFSQTGMQGIPYREVAPIQSYLDSMHDNSKTLDDTFGYQRPNYDMVSAVDEVHGDFRGSLRNYVINRIFDTRPELGHDFLAINPAEINDIFVNTNPDDDTIIGEIGFAVHAKRPVPRVVIPNLGK